MWHSKPFLDLFNIWYHLIFFHLSFLCGLVFQRGGTPQDVLNTPFAKLLKLPPPHVLNWADGKGKTWKDWRQLKIVEDMSTLIHYDTFIICCSKNSKGDFRVPRLLSIERASFEESHRSKFELSLTFRRCPGSTWRNVWCAWPTAPSWRSKKSWPCWCPTSHLDHLGTGTAL